MSDQQFIDLALSAGSMQIGIGRLAHGKAASRSIRALGSRLISDHSLENARLSALARRLGITPVPPLDKPPPELLIASGVDFDREFIPVETEALQNLTDLFQNAATGGQDQRLQRYARDTLPYLQRQTREVQALALRASQ
jgi:putative membrane protein